MVKSSKFTYYQVCCMGDDSQEKLYDLHNWLGIMGGLSLKERRRYLNGTLGRVEKINPLREFYAINFMRLDDIAFLLSQSICEFSKLD